MWGSGTGRGQEAGGSTWARDVGDIAAPGRVAANTSLPDGSLRPSAAQPSPRSIRQIRISGRSVSGSSVTWYTRSAVQ